MQPRPDDWRTPDADALLDALLAVEDRDEAAAFLRDLCTLGELRDLSQRWAVVRLLDAGLHYSEISRRTGASTATITRIASWLHHGEGGYARALERARARGTVYPEAAPHPHGTPAMTTRRMTLAVPNKGRLVEPTLGLLHDAGLVFEERDRSLVSRVENVEIDILFVRTNDVDRVRPRRRRRPRASPAATSWPSPRSTCRSFARSATGAAASPRRSRRTRPSARSRTSPASGSRPPTRGRRAPGSPSRSLDVEVISLSGAVEVAPRLGLAEAIVDLVSTGATLATNGLRPIGDLLASEAILVGNPAALRERADDVDRLVTMIGAVLEGRRRKYVMMNAPAARLAELESLLPGLESPSVIPLAHAGHDRDPRRGRLRRRLGAAPPPQGGRRERHPRPADREARPMSPTPVSMAVPTQPTAYAWEATDEQVAERYGVPLERIARFDLNTSPAPPDLALRLLRGGDYDRAISEYPPSDYRALVAAAAERYGVARDEILVGAGADEVLDLLAKAFLAPGAAAVVPTPTYAMYGVLTEQRPARPIRVPRRPAAEGHALDLPAVRAAARDAALVWLCSPNNPTASPSRTGRSPPSSTASLADAAVGRARGARRRPRRGLRRVRRGLARRPAARPTRGSSSCARPPRPTPSRGCGSASPSPAGSSSPRWSRTGRRGRWRSRPSPW